MLTKGYEGEKQRPWKCVIKSAGGHACSLVDACLFFAPPINHFRLECWALFGRLVALCGNTKNVRNQARCSGERKIFMEVLFVNLRLIRKYALASTLQSGRRAIRNSRIVSSGQHAVLRQVPRKVSDQYARF